MAVASVLIVSNGRGEDAVGAAIARAVADAARVDAYPLVGMGEAYEGVTLLEPRRVLPSGGFALRGTPRAILPDVRAGAISLWRDQRRALRREAGRHQMVLAIGDVYCLWMAAGAGSPVLFVATAKSEYTEPHSVLEVGLMRRHASAVFTRDAPTAGALQRRGINARFAGNPLVDVIPDGGHLPLPSGAPVVLLLPGSRQDAAANLAELLKLAASVGRQQAAVFLAALPPTLETALAVRIAASVGWTVEGSFIRREEIHVLLTHDFGSAVRAATVAAGLAGTANEQAAALGVPVVAFPPPRAVQYTRHFLRLQHRLLADALVPAPDWEGAARATVRLLRDPEQRARRAAAGPARMGAPGAIPIIAAEVRKILNGSGHL